MQRFEKPRKAPRRRIEKRHIAPRRPIIQTYITEDRRNKTENPLRQSAIYTADDITKRHTEHKTTIYQPGNMHLNPPNSAEHHEESSVNCASLPCPLRWHCVSVQNGSAYARLCRRSGKAVTEEYTPIRRINGFNNIVSAHNIHIVNARRCRVFRPNQTYLQANYKTF